MQKPGRETRPYVFKEMREDGHGWSTDGKGESMLLKILNWGVQQGLGYVGWPIRRYLEFIYEGNGQPVDG